MLIPGCKTTVGLFPLAYNKDSFDYKIETESDFYKVPLGYFAVNHDLFHKELKRVPGTGHSGFARLKNRRDHTYIAAWHTDSTS